MRTHRPSIVVLAAWVFLPCEVGCQEGMWGGEPKKLVPQQQLAKSDIPVPSGFTLDEASSEDKSSAASRYIRHVYLGTADNQLVRAFFREHMPVEKWTLLSDEMKQGQYVMQFEKEHESCEVTISQVGRGLFSKTKIRIEVSPRARGRAPKPTQEKAAP